MVKINVDVVVKDGKDQIRIVIVIRGTAGVVLSAATLRISGCFSPHMGDCMAVREGIMLAQRQGYSRWMAVVCAIQSPLSRSPDSSIIGDIQHNISLITYGSICYVSRFGNHIAHMLAFHSFLLLLMCIDLMFA